MTSKFGFAGALLISVAALAGCTAGLETRSFQSRLIEGAAPGEVLQAAEVILRREFGRVTVDPEQRAITSQAVEYTTASDSGTMRDLRGGESRLRKTAHFQLANRREGTLVRLRVEIEREDTEYHEQFQPRHDRLRDTPGSRTPIERDAATSLEQNTVWTFVRRDRRLERALLGELQELFAPAPELDEAQPTIAPADSTAP